MPGTKCPFCYLSVISILEITPEDVEHCYMSYMSGCSVSCGYMALSGVDVDNELNVWLVIVLVCMLKIRQLNTATFSNTAARRRNYVKIRL